MSKVLRLYNTFTKTLNSVKISGREVIANSNESTYPINGSFYICGPTVYSESHVGHAVTYIRADLFRRFMRSIFNVRLHTVMNITDIDDKILDATRKSYERTKDQLTSSQPFEHPFNQISDKYYKSFLDDMNSIRNLPADLHVKVSKHVHLITSFIRNLERCGHAYISSEGDVRFNVKSVKNYVGRMDKRQTGNLLGSSPEIDPRDFVLWKTSKPDEPVWFYESYLDRHKSIPGRPGWHVQCSAISSALFGNSLDFHFGGKDLIFPHHYNEEACCCAFHQLDTSNSLHVWSNNWLHSGHLVLQDRKMSKSLGNVVPIKNFIDRSSVNALRLLCIMFHYRADVIFDDTLMERIKSMDHRISAFVSFLSDKLSEIQNDLPESCSIDENNDIEQVLFSTQESVIDGICDDFHLDVGLDAIMHLSKVLYSKDFKTLKPRDIIASWHLIKDWCEICCLQYGYTARGGPIANESSSIKLLSDFRSRVRELTLEQVKKTSLETDIVSLKSSQQQLLKECDNTRAQMDKLGFVIRDSKS